MKVTKYWTGIVLVSLAVSCGRKPESDFPGNCTLSCSDAIIGSASEYDITPATDFESINYTCGAIPKSTPIDKPVRLHFRVMRTVANARDEANAKPITRPEPVPYISFEPLILGVLNTDAAGYVEQDAECSSGTAASTSPRCGVWTPQEQWCTDSCGVATIEVWPVCISGGVTNEVTVGLHSGSLFAKKSFKLTLTSEKVE